MMCPLGPALRCLADTAGVGRTVVGVPGSSALEDEPQQGLLPPASPRQDPRLLCQGCPGVGMCPCWRQGVVGQEVMDITGSDQSQR